MSLKNDHNQARWKKTRATMDLLVEFFPDHDWKIHSGGASYSCLDLDKGWEDWITVPERKTYTSDEITGLLLGEKCRVELACKRKVESIDEWFSTHCHEEADIAVLKKPALLIDRSVSDCRHY